MGHLRDIGGREARTMDVASGRQVVDTEYAAGMAEDIISKFDEFGLDEKFRGIVGAHIAGLQVVSSVTDQTSSLHVEKLFLFGGKKGHWQRQARISRPQLSTYQGQVMKSIGNGTNLCEVANETVGEVVSLSGKTMTDNQRRDVLVRSLAFDWIFYELCADALASSVYMQHRYGRYVRDFNGQSPMYRSELAISALYHENRLDRKNQVAATDHLSFRAGVGLELLKDNLIRKGIVDTQEQGDVKIEKLRSIYPQPTGVDGLTVPHSYEAVCERVACVEPRNSHPSARLGVAQVISLDTIRD